MRRILAGMLSLLWSQPAISQQYDPSMSADELYYKTHKLPDRGEDFPLPPRIKAQLERAERKPSWNAYFMAWDALRHGMSEQTLFERMQPR